MVENCFENWVLPGHSGAEATNLGKPGISESSLPPTWGLLHIVGQYSIMLLRTATYKVFISGIFHLTVLDHSGLQDYSETMEHKIMRTVEREEITIAVEC